MDYKNRLKRLRNELKSQELDGIMITNEWNRRYLSGFTGSAGVLYIDSKRAFIAVDSRYYIQASKQSPDFKLIKVGMESPFRIFKNLLKLSGRRIGFESDDVTVSQLKSIRKLMRGVNLIATKEIALKLRSIKDNDEVKAIQAAQKITDAAFKMLLKYVKPGMTEIEIAWVIERFMREQGAQKIAFPSIVASGPNSALPHAVASNRKIKKHDIVLFDMGCTVNGYSSDMTRTIFVGRPSEKMKYVYNRVLEAHLMVFELSKPGEKVASIDKISRDYIYKSVWKGNSLMGEEKGQGRYEHGLGHGVGLNFHEEPVLSYKRKKDILEVGQIVTNEPGIYIEEEGGVRIEDIMLVTKDGVESLTKSPKELISI